MRQMVQPELERLRARAEGARPRPSPATTRSDEKASGAASVSSAVGSALASPARTETRMSAPPSEIHVEDVLQAIDRVERLWRYVMRLGAVAEDDTCLEGVIAGLDAEVRLVDRRLADTRKSNELGRALMIKHLREQASMVRRFDPTMFLDLHRFDASESSRSIVDTTTAEVKARGEAQRAHIRTGFAKEARKLQEKIKLVNAEEAEERAQHEALVSRLLAKLGPSTAGTLRQSSAKAPLARAQAPRGLLPSAGQELPAVGQVSAAAAGSFDSCRSGRGVGSPHADVAVAPPSPAAPKRFAARAPAADDSWSKAPVRQWGAIVVGRLGLNSSPTKPRSYGTCMIHSGHYVVPRVARSLEEAMQVCPELSCDDVLGSFSTNAFSSVSTGDDL